MAWSQEETRFLALHYPEKGKMWCAQQLNKTSHQIRSKAFRMKIYQDQCGDFFKSWQNRAAVSKIGKSRPDQALVIKKLHSSGKLIKTDAMKKATSKRMKKWIKKHGHNKGMLGKKHSDEFKELQSVRSKKTWAKMTDDQRMERNKKIIHTRFVKGNYAIHRVTLTWKAAWREFGGKKIFYRSRWEANYGS